MSALFTVHPLAETTRGTDWDECLTAPQVQAIGIDHLARVRDVAPQRNGIEGVWSMMSAAFFPDRSSHAKEDLPIRHL